MDLKRPLEVITPTLDGDVLAVLARAEHAWSGRAIQREIGASHSGVLRALAHLVAGGVVTREEAGSAHLYRLNRQHLATPWIEGLAGMRLQFIDRLRKSVEGWRIRPTASVLFGSAARGDADRASDIDLLIVRPSGVDAEETGWREQLEQLQTAVAAWTGNDARILEFGESELISEEPVLAAAASEGIELNGSLRRILRRTRPSR